MMSDWVYCLAWRAISYELVGILMHAEHLEAAQGVGPHTISVPRICPADDIDTADFEQCSTG